MSDLELTMMRRVGELNKEVSRLKAEVERLTGLVESNLNQSKLAMAKSDAFVRSLEAQVERLTKAGDELHAFLINYIVESRISSAYLNKLDDGWNAAKEGNPKNSKDALEFIHTLDSLAIKKQKEEIERLCAWGRGLESDLSHARVEISFLKAESERLKEDNRQLTNAFEIAEGIIKRMGKAAEAAAKEGKPSV